MTVALERNGIDSEIFGCTVVQISGAIDAGDVAEVEEQCRACTPYYATLTLASDDLQTIHAFQRVGFQIVETKLRLTARIRNPHDLARYAYEMSEVEGASELSDVLSIAESTFLDDRVRNDPALGCDAPRLAGLRYRRYVEKSFHSDDEVLLKLVSRETGRILGFSTFRVLSSQEIVLLLGGVAANSKGMGLGAINNWFGWNEYIRRGFRRLTTHVSVRNTAILNLHVGGEGFKVDSAWTVLRKQNYRAQDC